MKNSGSPVTLFTFSDRERILEMQTLVEQLTFSAIYVHFNQHPLCNTRFCLSPSGNRKFKNWAWEDVCKDTYLVVCV